ncbi:hypothetical protein [Actinomadura fibrosa]|uniref:Uncharacterized protein n=1 Tax=Actinomadura fibrosa TaxID=111802 RepID=A0ABW2XYW0_9ACTN|nr:hypothetical protein [Actinomadura fibrosa]
MLSGTRLALAAVTAGVAMVPVTSSDFALAGSAAQVRSGGRSPLAGWEIEGKYWTHDGCVTAGYQGQERGDWSRFQCRAGTLQWVLWILRP